MAGHVLVTPAEEPALSLIQAKEHLRLTPEHTADDDTVEAILIAAQEYVETFTHRVLVEQTWRLVLDAFPPCYQPIELPRAPVQSVVTIRYRDGAGVQQILDPATYRVDTASIVARIALRTGFAWPSTDCEINAVEVDYVAGYATAEDVPEGIKAAMKLLIGDLYENRESSIIGTIVADNPTVTRLLWSHKVPDV